PRTGLPRWAAVTMDGPVSPRDPQTLAALLPGLLGRLTRGGTPAGLLTPIWSRIAGPGLAEHSRPTGLRGDRLEVTADDALWAGVLEVNAKDIVGRIQAS